MSTLPIKTYVIAEAGVNHNGSLEMAMKLVDAAAEAGADAVKFQTFKAVNLVSKEAQKASYQIRNTHEDGGQYDMLKSLELDLHAHSAIAAQCAKRGIQFLSTPFDFESLRLLVDHFDLPWIKIPSGEVTNAPFLVEIARTGKPVIMSTGMCTLSEVEAALQVLAFGYLHHDGAAGIEQFEAAYFSQAGRAVLQKNVALLHCTTEYPAPFEHVHLRSMATLHSAFGLPVGYSDHTDGIAVPIAAVALGASIIEKHFTLDKTLPGPDHQASLTPMQLHEMVVAIRQVEAAMGEAYKQPSPPELENRPLSRKSIVARTAIKKGDFFSEENLSIKRPGTGMSPMNYWSLLGRQAERNYAPDDMVQG